MVTSSYGELLVSRSGVGTIADFLAVLSAAITAVQATTAKTGTVSLAFLPEGGSEIRVQKAGYPPITIEVLISPRDTVQITLTLAKNE